MSVRSAQSITKVFTTRRFDTGAATNADSTPTGTLYVNGTANGATVTVTNITTGVYKAAVTLPTLAIGDIVDLRIAATVNSISDNAAIWTDACDLLLNSSGQVSDSAFFDVLTDAVPGVFAIGTAGYVLGHLLNIGTGGSGSSTPGAKTPIGSLTAYADSDDLILWHDERQIKQWCKDDNTVETTLSTNGKVTAALDRASGDVELACIAGGRYSAADLAALNGVAQVTLKALICDIAYCYIADRRVPNLLELPVFTRSMTLLMQLRDGVKIFPFQETIDASVDGTADLSTDSRGIHTRPTNVADRLFGERFEDREM